MRAPDPVTATIAAVAALGLTGAPAWAQDGPGVPAFTFQQGDLLTPLHTFTTAEIGARPTFAGMHRGYLIVAGGGVDNEPRALTLWEIDDPAAPSLFSSTPDATIFKTHAMGFSGNLLTVRAAEGALYDISNPASPQRRGTLGGAASSLWAYYAAPYVYKGGEGYGDASGWVSILDASDPDAVVVVNEINMPALVGFRCGSTHVLGNLLVVSASQTNGVVTFDIGDPQNPVLLDVLRVPGDTTYTSLLNGNRLYSGGQDGGLHVYDLTDPANIAHIGSVQPGGSVRYPLLQDEFIHLGNLGSDRYQKIDIDRLQLVASAALPGSEPEIALPMGNLVFVGNSQEDIALPGGYLLAHDASPDTRGVVVSAVRPADGETGVATTSMIGIALTDQIDPRTVDASTFTVRPLGGAPLAGTYTTQTGTLNFSPDAPLAPNTTYEVVVAQGGVRDLAGNGVLVASVTRFSTGASVAGAPPQAPSGLVATAAASTRVDLSWGDNSMTENAFLIERKTAMGPFLPLAQTPADVTAFSDASAAPFTRYTYRVRARGDGNSAFTSQVSVTTPSFAVNSGLDAHWRLDGDTLDASGNGHVATMIGNASFSSASAVGSHAVLLDGTTDWIATDDFSLGPQFSIAMWARVESGHTNIQTLAANTMGGSPAAGFRFFVNEYLTTNASIRFETQNGALGDVAFSAAGTFAFDQWNHVAVVVDRTAGVARIYYNGTDVTTVGTVLNDFDTDGPLELGYMFGNFALTGGIDDVRIYDGLLSPLEVATLADPAVPAAPGALNATAPSASAIDLAWQDNSGNESEFRIERRTGGGPFAQVATVAPDVTSYRDSGLAAATLYTYRVRSANHNGVSAYSAQASAVTSSGTGAPGLAAHWELDNDASNAIGSGNDGTVAGGAVFSGDRVIGSHSLALDGIDDRVDVGAMSLAERFTLATWVRIDSGSFNIQTLAANAPGGFLPDGFRFFVNAYDSADGSIRFETGNDVEGNVALAPAGTFAFDQWNHVAVVVDRPAGTARLYYNGDDVTTDISILSDFNLAATIHLGEMRGSGFWLTGNLDDTRVYARALDAAEIAGLAMPGTGGPLSIQAAPGAPALEGMTLSFDVAGIDGGEGVLEYAWDFNDGSPPTPFLTTSAVEHVFTAPGHYTVQLIVRDQQGQQASFSFLQTVHRPVTPGQPTGSGTIVYDPALERVWNVNPDNDSVTVIDASTLVKLGEYGVGDHPRTLARGPDGSIWVASQDDASISVLDAADGHLIETIALARGSAPYGIVFSPFGTSVYVTLEATGQLVELSSPGGQVLRSVDVGPSPRGIAVTGDGQRILVTRFISGAATGEVTEVDAVTLDVAAVITLARDPGPDTPSSARGVPNYLGAVTVSPDGTRAWVPSKKDNTGRGAFLDAQPLTFENTVRTIASSIDLAAGIERLEERIDFDNASLASAVRFSPLGDWAFVALTGNNVIDVRDAYSGSSVAGLNTGLAPQGLALSADGALLFSHDFTQRSVTVFDVSELSSGIGVGAIALTTIATVDNETLDPVVLAGKQVFYNAADPRMGLDGYLSCATCHLEGGQDGRVWDFTDRGEGLRNTIDLRGRAGMGHGNVHWTANFDEIQDFENDMRNAFGGAGFLTDPQYGATSDPLGAPKAGLSADLDALAAYVTSLSALPDSPYRAADGSLTPAAVSGRELFDDHGCSTCHAGTQFTDGQRHDVGTIQPSSGTGIGVPLAGVGFDTPTLKGVWDTAPYLHNGQAETLDDVLRIEGHGSAAALGDADRATLIEYLLQIDNDGGGAPPPACTAGQAPGDCDGDGVPDGLDNCILKANADQIDADGDGYGNLCDADYTGDCVVNVLDLAVLKLAFFGSDPVVDLNSDGIVNVVDLGIFRLMYFGAPGPGAAGSCP